MPWILAKEEKYEELETVLYNILESIRICSIFLKCFMPETADNIFRQLNTDKTTYDTLYFGCLENNHKLGQKEILFNRID